MDHHNKVKLFRSVFWVVLFLAALFFLYGLRRQNAEGLYATIGSLVLWGVSFLLNKWLVKEVKKAEDQS